jgi:Tfp pilus assembly protein PilX
VLPVVCATPLLSPNVMPWSAGMLYQPLGMSVQAGGGVLPNHGDQTPPDIYYNQLPMMYIQRLGLDPNAPNRTLYRVTSAGFGGDAASVSVLQSVTSIGTGP